VCFVVVIVVIFMKPSTRVLGNESEDTETPELLLQSESSELSGTSETVRQHCGQLHC